LESLKAQQQNTTEVAQNNPPPVPGQNGQQPTTKQLTGDATEYNLPGAKLAYGGKYDASKMAAAMTSDRAKNGQTVTVTYTTKDANGNPVTTTIRVVVNDTGPFARGANGRALTPLRPDPNIVIDLTPTAMRALTGSSTNRVPVTVTVPNE
jgi:protein-disulfide isomerase